ncbi:MAG: winged helix-turn-helix transcriptional regulator, partial [Caldilineaceae bacterium]|nr:winged helix-turn-helix transcriptional regulator [Caldilineaceae bacterium]
MNSNFNRQFILLDFRLLEDREFLAFLGSSEFATYLVLRRNVWRSSQSHYMGLHELYLDEKLLASSLERSVIASTTGVDPDNISRHLTSLTRKGVIRRVRTGRQNIYVLGEWVDVHHDGSYRLEWFYLEGQYGISKSDLTESVRSDLTPSSHQARLPPSDQTRRRASDSNRDGNRERKRVNGVGFLSSLPDLSQPSEKTNYVANFILSVLKDT